MSPLLTDKVPITTNRAYPLANNSNVQGPPPPEWEKDDETKIENPLSEKREPNFFEKIERKLGSFMDLIKERFPWLERMTDIGTFSNEFLEAFAKFTSGKLPGWLGKILERIGFKGGHVLPFLEGPGNILAIFSIVTNSLLRLGGGGGIECALPDFLLSFFLGFLFPNLALKEEKQQFCGLEVEGLDITNRIPKELGKIEAFKKILERVPKPLLRGVIALLFIALMEFLLELSREKMEDFLRKITGRKKIKTTEERTHKFVRRVREVPGFQAGGGLQQTALA